MDAREFDLQFDIEGPFENGSLVALCKQVPMIVSATSEEDLRERVSYAVNQLTKFLAELGPGKDVEYLEQTGVDLRDAAPGEPRRSLTFPVLLRAAG